MTLLVLFRTRLEWCNYHCGYCPWNADENRVEAEMFREDERRLNRVIDRVGELPREVEFFITPKAEYLVLPYWRAAVGRLLSLPHVKRVTVQTNLSFDVASWIEEVESRKLSLWTTYHPTETTVEAMMPKWLFLREKGIRFSVGIVAMREQVAEAERLRSMLPADVYLWANAYKREPDYYSEADLERITAVDPLFRMNAPEYASRGRPCTAGQRAVYLDDEGDIRRCLFVGGVMGNLFRDGWVTEPAPKACPAEKCRCYVGQMHAVELDFRSVYGENLAARIPLGGSEWVGGPPGSLPTNSG